MTLYGALLSAILVPIVLGGCATQGAKTASGLPASNHLESFQRGDLRLHCGLACSGAYGYSRSDLKLFYRQGLWDELVSSIAKTGFLIDQAYFYLAEAAQQTGRLRAAEVYFQLALSADHRCKGLLNVCDGIDVQRLSQEGLSRLRQIETETIVAEGSRPGRSEQRQATRRYSESPRQAFALSVSSSPPDDNGVVTISVTTSSDTSSLTVNGDEEGGRADGRYSLRRFAQVGENYFQITATDRFGNRQTEFVSITREFAHLSAVFKALNPLAVTSVSPRNSVAVVIGIEKYRRIPSADFANRDASMFVDYARRAFGVPLENIRLLLDEKADAGEILLTLKNWLPTRVQPGKTDVYIFYSGHGLPSDDGSSLYFLPHEANRDLLERTAISQREIIDALKLAQPKSVTLFIDSCYSGQSRTGETLMASARPIVIAATIKSSFPEYFTVMSASAPNQISSSSPELRHGIFSYYLMRGMEGEADSDGDRSITVGEMQSYLEQKVPRRAMSMNRNQHPQVVGDPGKVLLVR